MIADDSTKLSKRMKIPKNDIPYASDFGKDPQIDHDLTINHTVFICQIIRGMFRR